MNRISCCLAAFCALILAVSCTSSRREVKLLYWNIQNGMWADQGRGYDGFVDFVKSCDPDICVWCEAETRYVTDSAVKIKERHEAYLPYNWDLLARRYGHRYFTIAGKRDEFPQVITSRYPLYREKSITGTDSVIVAHGSGVVQVDLGSGDPLRIVTVHTWPAKYAYLAEDRKASAAEQGGDVYRSREVAYICRNSILEDPDAAGHPWIMLGDFNAVSRNDNFHLDLDSTDKCFFTHNYVLDNTPYRDLVAEKYPGDFQKTTVSGRRIDFIYLTDFLMSRVKDVRVLREGFAAGARCPEPEKMHNFCRNSDHYPIFVTFGL